MQDLRGSFSLSLLLAVSAIIWIPNSSRAQDMPPILAPIAPPTPAAQNAAPASPSAEAVIPPAVAAAPPASASKQRVALTDQPKVAQKAAKAAAMKHKFAALMKKLAPAHVHPVTHRVAIDEPPPGFPPGALVPPPGYYPPGPRERLVYGGPPRGPYGGWGGYRYPYYP
jgi:hypothetical protein